MSEANRANGKRLEAWIAVINGDEDGFAEVVTERAGSLPTIQDAVHASPAIRQWVANMSGEHALEHRESTVEVCLPIEWAVEQADFVTEARNLNGEAMSRHQGSLTLLWRRAGNRGMAGRALH